ARLAARVAAPVLIVGEPGTGKEWVARTIHYAGNPGERAFAALDCTSLPAAALHSALFGPGGLARSSAVATLYLKEPAALPRAVRAGVADLRAGTGAGERAPRVVAGCETDAAADVRAGRLLDELHCALGTLVIELPPLAGRAADLPWLVERLLARAGEE